MADNDYCISSATSRFQTNHARDNLLQNALEAIPEGGTLTIGCVKNASRARLRIADTGGGISI